MTNSPDDDRRASLLGDIQNAGKVPTHGLQALSDAGVPDGEVFTEGRWAGLRMEDVRAELQRRAPWPRRSPTGHSVRGGLAA